MNEHVEAVKFPLSHLLRKVEEMLAAFVYGNS